MGAMTKLDGWRWYCAGAGIVIAAALVSLPLERGVGRRVRDLYHGWQDRRRIADVWDQLAEADSRISSGGRQRTIVEFVDYGCSSCRSLSRPISNAAELGVTVVYRHLPTNETHSGSRNAALAAICAETHGVFAEAHEAMLGDDTWVVNGNWGGLAERLGVATGSFGTCMSGSQAHERLEADRELAEFLGIRESPAFVTPAGIFEGAEGWAAALEALSAGRGNFRGETWSTLELAEDTLFDSAAHPNAAIATLGRLSTAMFLPGDRLLIQDGVWFHFVDLGSEQVVTVGGRGRGPGEFQTPWQTVRFAGGVAVWDMVLMRLSLFSDSGEYMASRSINIDQLRSPVAPLVAAHADGSAVFRDDSTSAFGKSATKGPHREPIHYMHFSPDGIKTLVHRAMGEEVVHKDPSMVSFLFAHTVLEARLGGALAIAQTDLSTIEVVARTGNVALRVPMPARVDVSKSQIESARKRSIEKEQRDVSRLARQLDMSPNRRLLSYDVPVNDPAPAIDGMFGDLEGRKLWLRRYRLPGDTVVRWDVWAMDMMALDARLIVPKGAGFLLDVDGEKALLHVRDAFDVDRVLVRGMVRPTGPSS